MQHSIKCRDCEKLDCFMAGEGIADLAWSWQFPLASTFDAVMELLRRVFEIRKYRYLQLAHGL